MGDTAESVDVTKTIKEGVTKKESEELFSDVSSMEIVETDGFSNALIEEGDEDGFIVEDTLSDVSISEILDSNVVLDEAYSDDEEEGDDSTRESLSKLPDDVLSDISSVCSVPAVKGKQSSSRSKHSSKSLGGAESAAKNTDVSSDKSQKVDSSRRRHESANTSISKASSEKSECYQPSSKSRKLPEGIIPLKDRRDEYRCTVCYCYLASRRIMERHIDDYQHCKRAQHISTIDNHSPTHSSREKRKHEDIKEPQKSVTKMKESSESKKAKLEKTKENKESKGEERTTSEKKNQKETSAGVKKTESEKTEEKKESKGEEKTTSDKKNQKETLTGAKKTESEKAKESKENKEEKTTSDKKNQKETLTGAKKTESEKAKESKGEEKTAPDKKNQKETLTGSKKTELEKAKENKESKGEEKTIFDKKNQKETSTSAKKTESEKAKESKGEEKITSDKKNQKETLTGATKIESEKTKESKEEKSKPAKKNQKETLTDPNKKASDNAKEEATKGTVGDNKEQKALVDKKDLGSGVGMGREAVSSSGDQDKEEVSVDTEKSVAAKTEESKETVKFSADIKQDTSAEASGKEEHKETQTGSKENAEKVPLSSDAKHPVKGTTEESKEKVAKLTNEKKQDGPSEALGKNKDHKESRKPKDHKESQKDKEYKESQKNKIRKETPKENKRQQKETAKGKESSSSTGKPGKKREKEVEKDGVAMEMISASKKPRLENEVDKNKTETKGDPRVLRHLSDMKQPILGIEKIFLSGNDGNWIYHCNLCSVACGSVDIRPHLLGRRHRTSYALYHRQKPYKAKRCPPRGYIGRQLTIPPRFSEERNFREEDPPFSSERSDDWKQAHWNDCCNSFLKITMDRDDSPLRRDFEHPIDRSHEKSFRGHFNEEMESNIHRPQLSHDPRFDIQDPPPQFQQPDYMSHQPPQHQPHLPHFQEYPRFQEPEYPPPFQMERQPPHFQELGPSHPPVPPHRHQPEFPMPQQFHQPEPQAEPQFQKPYHPKYRELVYPEIKEKLTEQKNPPAIPTNNKAAPSKSSKDKTMAGNNAPATKTSEAAVDIINLMIQDYLKNELQKLPSQLQKILCESKRAEDSKKSMQAASDIEIAKGKKSSRSKLSVEKDTSGVRDSVSRTSQDSKKGATKVIKRVKPEDVASSFDQHSYKNVENMQTIPFLGVASSLQDLSDDGNERNKSSNNKIDDASGSKDEGLNSQNDGTTSASTMDATSNCFEQFIKSWIEHTGAVPIRSSQTESLDKSLKENTDERNNMGEPSNQMFPDFSNIDHAELGRQVAAFLSKHSANLNENIGNILMGKNPQSSISSMSSEINATIEKVMTSNTSRGSGIGDMNRHVNPFIDQSNRGHGMHGMNREMNSADVRQFTGEHPNVRDEAYKRVPDNWDGDPRNRGSNPSNQPASYWVASGRDGLPTRIYYDETVDGYHNRNRSEMARGNMDSVPNTYQERRMNTDDIRGRQHTRGFNRRGRGTLPFRSPHSLSFLDLLNQHRNDPVFNPGISRPGVSRRSYY